MQTLSPEQTLLRASVLLRGTRPSLEEYDRLDGGLEPLVDEFLESPEFGAVVRRMHGEWLLTDTFRDYYPMNFPAVGALAGEDLWALNTSVSEAPARLAERIVVEDRPYTELVTADYTMADRVVSTVWGLPYDAARGGWQQTRFLDGRAGAGLLVDPWYFTRHASTDTNRQHARAAHVARALLCHDYMSRSVRVPADVDLTAGGANSLTENAVCVSCHSTLDEFGAFFTNHVGVVFPEATVAYPVYQWPAAAGDYPPPAFSGTPGRGLADLGELIADDPRFARCAIRRFYGQVMGLDEADVPDAVEDRYVADFMGADFRVKRLLKRMVLSDEFAAVGDKDPALEHVTGLRRLGPWHLARSVEDLTGYVWDTRLDVDYGIGVLGTVPLMDDITWGFRELAGGADGMFRFDPSRTATPTTLLVLRELAGLAAGHAVAQGLDGGLIRVGADADRSAVREQIAELHLRLYGARVPADDPAVDAVLAVFDAGGGTDDPDNAWTLVLFAMLQDPRILFV